MILFLFGLIFTGAIAGPDEDRADNILAAYVKAYGGKNVPASNLVYPYQLNLGTVSTSIDVMLSGGQMNLEAFSRLSPIDMTSGLAFTAQIDAKFSYRYDFRSSVPSTFAAGNATIDWKAPVSMRLFFNGYQTAFLDSIRLLNNGSLVGKAVPFVGERSVSLYPKGDSDFATLLFSWLQGYLRKTFKDISY